MEYGAIAVNRDEITQTASRRESCEYARFRLVVDRFLDISASRVDRIRSRFAFLLSHDLLLRIAIFH